ncbi:hypothetical protein P152DRAFT_194699 [Eremomyces bilateralis CBS 781.70]|uniref:RRM domain-containing protein n=1 Tax=Eremomyces bilateralis CBS 781.70 TaxID=1392243 RepID=A0A6G1GCA9_9PEZI|nr:uncharacterized protein P152DRAFT_194699 [Eremomyces bilateralis CBS 781.70]KAF1815738.1 hypothetical protein P152DRAFT_194699 [Eremomyces bilateralis CBS 781.70]
MAPPKSKTQKMSLGDFLGDQTLGSWADEMEDSPMPSADGRGYSSERRTFSSQPGFGGGDRGFGTDRPFVPRELLPLPTKPPFTVHLGNLSYDATETEIDGFFTGCQPTSVRIVEDKLDHKPKGFGYVEFATLDGLKKALDLNGTQFQGRNIKISIAEPQKDRLESNRDFGDWSRKGPLPDLPNQNRRTSDKGGFRGFDAASDAGSDAGGRRAFRPDDGKVRDFNNWERKGPMSPAGPPAREGGRTREGPPRERNLSPAPAWGEGRSQDGSRPPRGEFREQAERAPTAAELDSAWRDRMRPDAPAKSPIPTPEASTPTSPAAPPAPVGRPKLNLQKRTVSDTDSGPSAAAASDAKASPFGAARPIDTAAREREVEEKRQLAIRQKREADEKAREDKKAKEVAAKAAAEKAAVEKAEKAAAEKEKPAQAAATAPQANGKPAAEDGKANGEDRPAGKSYEILRRESTDKGEDGKDRKEDATEAPANGETAAAARPREGREGNERPRGGRGGRPYPATKRNDSWRKPTGPPQTAPAAAAEAKAEPTAEADAAPEDDGWSTVQSGKRGGKRNTGRGQA